MIEPRQKPGRSKQDYGTPWPFIRAVEARWGALDIDLAAYGPSNAKAQRYLTPLQDSLTWDWSQFPDLNAWLNPPFGDIGTWAAKCAQHAPDFTRNKGRIFLLTPASIGSEWFEAHVHRKALVIGLRPRLTFEGTSDPYPKDLMLSVFGETPGFDTWRWDRAPTVAEAANRGTLGANIITERGR